MNVSWIQVPVYRGCDKSLVGGGSPSSGYHGGDGLGDVKIEGVDPVQETPREGHASTVLVDLVNKYPGTTQRVFLLFWGGY